MHADSHFPAGFLQNQPLCIQYSLEADEGNFVLDYGVTKYDHPAGMSNSMVALPSL